MGRPPLRASRHRKSLPVGGGAQRGLDADLASRGDTPSHQTLTTLVRSPVTKQPKKLLIKFRNW